jgi:hypothetical protein
MADPSVFTTSFCNKGHLLCDGRPIDHECYVIPPYLLRLEMWDAHNTAEEWSKWCNGRRTLHKGVILHKEKMT